MATYIHISEEFGYRFWLWKHPGTPTDVEASWRAGRIPVSFWGARPDPTTFDGEVEQIPADLDDENWFALRDFCVGEAHVHMDDDTWLCIADHPPISIDPDDPERAT